MTSLVEELHALSAALKERLAAHHFDAGQLGGFSERLANKEVVDNHVKGQLAAPASGDLVDMPQEGSVEAARLEKLGLASLARGENGLVVLAGGMATRMGGVVKALVEALPGKTFLELRLGEQRTLEKRAGRPVPLYLMTSAATDTAIKQALGPRLDGKHIATFAQRLSLRLNPDGTLFKDEAGNPSEYAPGHGDFVDALAGSGLLRQFMDGGGKTLTVANLDNLGATLDPVMIGLHVERGNKVTCEVVDKLAADRGGIPCRVDGRLIVLEEFRIPPGFDPATVRTFSTNTFHMDAAAIAEHRNPWSYFLVNKKVSGRAVIQFERLINELTSHFDTTFVRVPREGAGSRFLPVKDNEELASRRPELEVVARARGMLD
ncbi:MAG TPA: UTP--glucose-1-phosphate uridylyltransferase [Polyangiaceae bacterium]|jgi:UTP--glucose-1-phosphate uridylyltransferase|nr:UTP--glucose-1-phosphate uridylyltransferase [Polyangiaceae bacterium]